MSYDFRLYSGNVKDGVVSQHLYLFNTPNNTYCVAITPKKGRPEEFSLMFDLKERLLAPFGAMPIQSVGEGVALSVFETVANILNHFYVKYKLYISKIVLRGNRLLYPSLIDRYQYINPTLATIIHCD